ncbi:hypothetical protein [Vibrio sp. TBV020]|uniref:hypothetical protein n=1 Tax=Vibrio sp. TBV020 TaxID=3137398 RepID=UPI0038CD2949
MSNVLSSKVLMIRTKFGDRFFSRFGKGGSVQTAWSFSWRLSFLLSTDLIEFAAKKKHY